MTKIHPAIAEHAIKENQALHERIAQLEAETESTWTQLEQVTGLLRDAANDLSDWKRAFQYANHEPTDRLLSRIRAALSQKAEPTDTFTAADMATAAAQGFRDGQAAVEQAAAQDEREAPQVVARLHESPAALFPATELTELGVAVTGTHDLMTVAQHQRIVAALTRPAQTEQQPEQSGPANKLRALAEIWDQNADEADEFGNAQAAEALRLAAFELRAALSAQRGEA